MTEEKKKNYFEELSEVNVSDKVEKKNGLSYLSWAFAWSELKKRHPEAKKNVVKNQEGWLYHTDGKTCWVEVSVTINGIEEVEYLPILDFRNQPITLDKVTSMHVNTSIQRAITKAIARHGLGLYIYAGEDLPEADDGNKANEKEQLKKPVKVTPKIDDPNELFERLAETIKGKGSISELEGWLENKKVIAAIDSLPEDLNFEIKARIDHFKIANGAI